MKIKDICKDIKIIETASAGTTTSGCIATVVNPVAAHNKKSGRRKKNRPDDNALDSNENLFSGQSNSVVKRPY